MMALRLGQGTPARWPVFCARGAGTGRGGGVRGPRRCGRGPAEAAV